MSRIPSGRSAAHRLALFAALSLAWGCATPEGYEEAADAARKNALDTGNRLYEEAMARRFRIPLERAVRSCSVSHPDARGVRILSRLDARGAVQETILYPDAAFGQCVHGKISDVEFAAPPEPDYWFSLEVPAGGVGEGG